MPTHYYICAHLGFLHICHRLTRYRRNADRATFSSSTSVCSLSFLNFITFLRHQIAQKSDEVKKWLELSPYVEYYISRLETPSQNINFDYWRIGDNITASFENLSLIFNVNSPTKVYDGDLLSRGSLQYAGTIQYKIGNWSVGAKYNYSGHNNYTVSNSPILRYNENKDWKPLQHMARLTATYTFSVGKSRRHDGKILIESSKDNTGLGKFNTPQISK